MTSDSTQFSNNKNQLLFDFTSIFQPSRNCVNCYCPVLATERAIWGIVQIFDFAGLRLSQRGPWCTCNTRLREATFRQAEFLPEFSLRNENPIIARLIVLKRRVSRIRIAFSFLAWGRTRSPKKNKSSVGVNAKKFNTKTSNRLRQHRFF